jgi:hypothetical protein
MNKRALILWASLALLSGCAQHYTITLNNGMQIPTKSKPKLENGCYYFKDMQGRKAFVPAGRVLQVAPTSMVNEENAAARKAQPAK